MPKALTRAAISRLRPGDYAADSHVRGLRVEAFKGCKSFIYRYNDPATGRQKQVTVGNVEDMAIADARDAVRALKRSRADGLNPQRITSEAKAEAIAENIEATAEGPTIKSLIDDYAREHLAPTKRGAERERTLRQDLKKWYGREASSLTRRDVKELLAAIAERAPNTAGRVLRELRAAYRHALEAERIAEGVDPTNQVKAPDVSSYVPRDRAFTDGEWRTWFRWLPSSGMSSDVQDALRLVALTACRPGEVTAMRWRDVDLEGRTWVIREGKRGPGRSHLVYLNAPAIAILSRRKPDNVSAHPFVFASPNRRGRAMREHAIVWSLSNARGTCDLAHWTAHDVRRSAATLLGNIGYSTDLISRVLGHYSIRRPTDIYNRATRDTEAREAWIALGAKLSEFAKPQPVRRRA
jgi:integrase